MKLCVACRHYEDRRPKWSFFPPLLSPSFILDACMRDEAKSKVHGHPQISCQKMRDISGPCGPDGKLWEAK